MQMFFLLWIIVEKLKTLLFRIFQLEKSKCVECLQLLFSNLKLKMSRNGCFKEKGIPTNI